jgi:uncharacterized membrane protein YcaP (DUF421 family)
MNVNSTGINFVNPFVSGLFLIFVKTSVIYWVIILGLRMLGRRAIGQLGPHEFILIALLTKIMADQIITKELGLWGNLVGGLTLFLYVALIDSNSALRAWVQGSPLYLMKKGEVDHRILTKHHLSIEDLERVARHYGYATHEVFEAIVMERDGRLSGVLKPVTIKLNK